MTGEDMYDSPHEVDHLHGDRYKAPVYTMFCDATLALKDCDNIPTTSSSSSSVVKVGETSVDKSCHEDSADEFRNGSHDYALLDMVPAGASSTCCYATDVNLVTGQSPAQPMEFSVDAYSAKSPFTYSSPYRTSYVGDRVVDGLPPGLESLEAQLPSEGHHITSLCSMAASSAVYLEDSSATTTAAVATDTSMYLPNRSNASNNLLPNEQPEYVTLDTAFQPQNEAIGSDVPQPQQQPHEDIIAGALHGAGLYSFNDYDFTPGTEGIDVMNYPGMMFT